MSNEHDHKKITIVVNARPHDVEKDHISYEEVVALSGLPQDENTIFTITFNRGHHDKPQGQLVAGDSVKVKDGMIFNVTPTNRS